MVLLHDDEPEASEKLQRLIEENFPGSDHYKFSDFVYLVTGARLVTEVKEKLNFNEDDNLYGAILRLNGSHAGRSWVALWDWLRAAEERR